MMKTLQRWLLKSDTTYRSSLNHVYQRKFHGKSIKFIKTFRLGYVIRLNVVMMKSNSDVLTVLGSSSVQYLFFFLLSYFFFFRFCFVLLFSINMYLNNCYLAGLPANAGSPVCQTGLPSQPGSHFAM